MDKQLDLLLIRPGDQKKVYGSLSQSLSAIEPPLWAALIAAYVREQGYSVQIIDVDAEGLSPEETAVKAKELKPRFVGFIVTGNNLSASTWLMTGAGLYHSAIKKKIAQAKTFFWGLHASALPARTLKEEKSDFVIVGEGVSTIVQLIRGQTNELGLWSLVGNEVVDNGRSPIIKDLNELPVPAWDLLPMEKYRAHNWHCNFDENKRQPYGVLYASLGCPFNCSFCALKTLFNGKPGIRYRSPAKVLEDLDLMVQRYKIKNIKILDECFGFREKYVIDVCDLIIERGYDLNMWAYARVDTVNPKMLAKMRQAGITWLCYGIESPNKKVLADVAKGKYGIDEIRQAIKLTKEAGINILANFMVGLPEDDLETMQSTLDLAKELNCEYTNIYATMAYPGSKLYGEALEQNIPLPKNWRGYSAFSEECLPLPTKHISAKEVLQFRDQAFDDFHGSPVYLTMIKEKFGQVAVVNIKNMLKHKLKRELLK